MPHRKRSRNQREKKKNISSKEQPVKHEIKEYDHPKLHLDHFASNGPEVSCDIGNVKKATEEDDETLLNVIDSADLDQINTFLNKNHTFSQNGLDKALILASRHGLKYLVQTLVRRQANVQFKDTHGNTPLLICVQNDFVDIVHFLLKKKADVNSCNSSGDTALILSIKASGSSEMVKVLLEQEGIDIRHQNCLGHTALTMAVKVRDVDVMRLLMKKLSSLEVDDTCDNIQKNSSLEPTQTISWEIAEQKIAEIHGLGNVYHILETSIQMQESPLVVAVEKHDTESLTMLLDCRFVEKYDVCQAFQKIFQNCELKEVKAISKDEIVMVTRLLEYGADMNTCWYNGSNPLAVAVETGDYNLVELLCQNLKQQQQLNWHSGFTRFGTEALSAAAKFGLCDIIELLLKYDAVINGYNYSNSPLDCALIHKHFDSAKLLIQYNANMNIENALQSAVNNQVPEYLNFLLNNYQPEIINYAANGTDSLNKLLLSAVKGGNLEIIGHLLDAGADVNYQGNFSGDVPLVESKNGDVARFLISRGANVSSVMHEGDTPLVTILQNRRRYSCLNSTSYYDSSDMEIVKVLLENGASVNERRMDARTPVMIAASNEVSVPMLQILLDHGADLNVQDGKGNTAIICAVSRDCLQNVSFLLQFYKENDLGLNVQNSDGLTAVMHAVISSNSKMLKELLDFNVDVNIKDRSGNTALHHVMLKMSSEESLTTLIRAGSDVNCQNDDGFSPLMLASRICWKKGILTLLDSGVDVNAVSKKDSTKTAFSFLSPEGYYRNEFKSCLQALLSRGASSSYANPDFLHKIILCGGLDVIPELIQRGLGPADIDKSLCYNFVDISDVSAFSPLCSALLWGNIPLAQYFVDKLFLTNSDVTNLTKDKNLYALEIEHQQESLAFFEKISSQPLSLFQFAFVAVSSAVGTSPGRESRVNSLPLPQPLKDKLLFKSEDVQLNIAATDIDYLDPYQVMDPLTLFNEVISDSDNYSYSGIGDDSDDYVVYDDTYW